MNESHLKTGRYRHYKGNDYQVLYTARHSETEEWLVVYRCLYGDYSLWVRPYDHFIERVEVGGKSIPRFAFVETMAENELVRSLKE